MIKRDAIKVLHDPRDLITAQHHRSTNRHPSARDVFDRADLDV